MSVVFQALCTGIICSLSMSMGIIFSWPSCTLQMFGSQNTTLHRPMSEAELALFGSLSSIGAMISTPVAGYLLDVIGRKYCAICTSLIYVVTWGLITATSQVEVILTAVFIGGLASAAMLIARVYVSEICQESVRGAMSTGSTIFYSTGLLLSYVLGGTLEYKALVGANLAISIVGAALPIFLKESPTFLMKKGLEQEAAISIAFYRRVAPDSKEVLEELDTLRRAFNPDLGEVAEEEKLNKVESDEEEIKKETISFWKFFKNSRSTRIASILMIAISTLATFQGQVVIQVYAKPLFEAAVPSMSPLLCSVLQAIVTVVCGLMAGYLSDFAGRRPLMIYSSIVAGLCCLVLGSALHLNWAPVWVTPVFLFLYNIASTFGAGTVTYVLITEVFLPEIKSVMSMLIVQWCWFCSFIILFIFNPLVSFIGLGPVFYIFAGVCFFTAGYCAIYMPETTGLPVDTIQTLLLKKAGFRSKRVISD